MIGRKTDLLTKGGASLAAHDPALQLLEATRATFEHRETTNDAVVSAMNGHLLEQETPAAISADFGAKIFAQIDQHERDISAAQTAAYAAGAGIRELLNLPDPLKELALESAGRGGWTFAGAGVKAMPLDTGGKLKAKLLRIEPGHGAPNHDHTGTEYTLVLAGAFHDGADRYGPGDLSVKRVGQIHHPIATHDGVCIALSVEEGGVAFTGALGLLQRMFTRH
jgi:putative transcriptional regulator